MTVVAFHLDSLMRAWSLGAMDAGATEHLAGGRKVSATDADWEREAIAKSYDPSRRLLGAIRAYQRHPGKSLWHTGQRKRAVLEHRWWSVICGCDIPINCRLGGGLLLPHPSGVVIHPDAVIGPNCLIFQNVTLGTVEGEGPPRIGGHVDIGAGAKILGNVAIGDHAKIGANAVVLHDVPAHGVAVGVPAHVVEHRDSGVVPHAKLDLGA